MRKWGCAIAGLIVGAWPVTAMAQDQSQTPPVAEPAPSPDAEAGIAEEGAEEQPEEIVVTGTLRGAVQSDIPAEVQLSPADIRSYGVNSISELLTELAPQTGSGRGRGGDAPVVLLSGRRISGFRELQDIPTEAIERVDILPEEVALKYGYRADQRVVNIVLRERFRAVTTELTGSMPTAGGTVTSRGNFGLNRISRDGRLQFDVKYNATSGLLESERDLLSRNAAGQLADVRGNITGIDGGQIDPALSALVGSPVTQAGVPVAAAGGMPTLADFAGTAGTLNVTDLSPYRSLIAPSKQLNLNGVLTRNLSEKVTGTFNLSLDATQSRTLLGLPDGTLTIGADSPFSPFAQDVQLDRFYDELLPLSRSTRSTTAHAGFSFNGDGLPWDKEWRWSLTGNYDRTNSRTITQRGIDLSPAQALADANDPGFNPFGPLPLFALNSLPANFAQSTTNVGSVDALLNGPLFKLPAGDVATSIRVSGRTSDLDSYSLSNGVARTGDISRQSGSFRANIDLPLTSRRREVLSAIGDVSLNGNIEVEQLSDFGTLITTGYGVNWSPIPALRLIASFTDEEGAPSASQLGGPILVTPNVRVFDFVRGETVDVTTTTGGNPFLTADSRHVMKLGLNLRPFEKEDFNLSANYVTSKTRNQISSFPSITAQVEAAFPGRFTRDASGRLIALDNRSVNFNRAERQELRWGFNFSKALTSAREREFQARRAQMQAAREAARSEGSAPPAEVTPPGDRRQGAGEGQRPGGFFGRGPGGPGGGRGVGPRGGFGGRGPGARGGRLRFSLFHTWQFKNEIEIRDGLPVLDLLDGATLDDTSGNGVSAHALEGNAGYNKDGLGVNLTGNWRSGRQVLTGEAGSGDQLNFNSLTTLNLRVFADLGQLAGPRKRWARGSRVSLSIQNIFDARQRVTDATGIVPLNFQRDLVDRQGRTVRLSFRKLFF
ncbi:TonB-dependent receptor [Sphingomonas xinjiangensis]|uniref:TonB-dependent receptor n=1 Tax=Sphingomonas xinjiangensis TaxID=643568 RepID=A0A840YG14_9SPHN|nr:TonB-dependent receptor [Sphingomonas xinjiangensis]MBB5711235.1 hypothetical protein [Sphingomonas xinjiangensis]